jgi:hypothetical protein
MLLFTIGTYTVRYCGVLVPPPGPGVVTVIVSTRGMVSSEAGTSAVSDVALVNVVGCAAPSMAMTDALVNPVPATAIV